MPVCIVCLGSNDHKEKQLCFARKRLAELFLSVRFAEECETEPLLLTNPALFLNQVASFYTNKEMSAVIDCLKRIEQEAGRSPADKLQELVRLDIDLLMYDDIVLKPKDMTRTYVANGLRRLREINKIER